MRAPPKPTPEQFMATANKNAARKVYTQWDGSKKPTLPEPTLAQHKERQAAMDAEMKKARERMWNEQAINAHYKQNMLDSPRPPGGWPGYKGPKAK